MRRKVAIIGHVAGAPTAIPASDNPRQLDAFLRLNKYTRVLTDQRLLVDHIAYLKQMRGIPAHERFSVWEMYLCAALLLKSHLERHGCDVLLINVVDSDNQAEAMRGLAGFSPDIVVLSTTFILTTRHLVEAGRLIRSALPDTFIVAGGHHIFTTLMYMTEPEQAHYLCASQMNAFVNDVQGERTLLDLVRGWPDRLGEVPNLVWRAETGEVLHNRRVEENNDINDTLITFNSSFAGSVAHIRTARSCAFKCAFCSYPTIAGDLALMDLDHVVATVRQAKEAGVKAIFFVDDTFNVPRPRFEKLLERLVQADLGMPWYSFLRCQFVDHNLVRLMRRSGCQGVFLGVESGADQVLNNMNKGGASSFYSRGIKWLREEGIITVGAFVIGFPGETRATVQQTAEFIDTSGLDFYFLQPFYYLHHTPVYKVAEKYALTGKGLEWSHATMNASEACRLLDEVFLQVRGSVFVNPDYTLWEVAYLLSKGMSLEDIRAYRAVINEMTAAQMSRVASVGVQRI